MKRWDNSRISFEIHEDAHRTQSFRMMKIKIFIICILILPGIFAACEQGQIDINSATTQELVKISYVGQVRAEQLITLRPFSDIDDLLRIVGIGEVYLAKIKEQGLACVEESKPIISESVILDNVTNDILELNEIFDLSEKDIIISNENKKGVRQRGKEIFIPLKVNEKYSIVRESLSVETKNIKSKENKEILDKSIYAKYGLILFCLILITLFIKNKKHNKNEFR